MSEKIVRKFDFGEKGKESIEPSSLSKSAIEKIKSVGIEIGKDGALYLQMNHNAIYTAISNYLKEKGIIVMSTEEAYEKLPWARKYFWNVLKPEKDTYTKLVQKYWRHGYFIYVPPNTQVEMPIQACLFISKRNIAQPVHNVVIVDEKSTLHLITGCATMVNEGLHIGISEFYIKRNAKLTFTMIHGWAPKFNVKPRSAALVEEGGTFISYYVNLYPVQDLQMHPTIYLKKNSSGHLTSILLGRKNATIDVGGRIVFLEEGAKGEITSRSIARDEARIVMRGNLVAKAKGVKGHLECKGLLLSPKASTVAIPILESYVDNVDLTHEAAIGKISEEQLYYLMSKGFTEEEAIALIVRGFIEVGLDALPKSIQASVKVALNIIERLARG